MKEVKYQITGMTCAACQANITRAVKKIQGVKEVNVSLLSNQMQVAYDETQTTDEFIMNTVKSIGYGASMQQQMAEAKSDFRAEWETRQNRAEDVRKTMWHRLIYSVLLLIPLMYIAMGPMIGLPTVPILEGMENALILALTQLFLTLPILMLNKHFYESGIKALVKRVPNMDSLVAMGSLAALLYGIFSIYRMAYGLGHNDMEVVHEYAHALYFESAAMIVTLVTVGKYLEAKSKAKTSDALGKLVNLAPKTASVIRDGREQTIPAEQVVMGDIVIIRPGERIPVDGIVTEGYGYVDQSAITGESIPVEKHCGDSVISASMNKNGSFRFQASKVGNDTTLAQIIRLVDEAGNTKAPIARLADKVSSVFVPVVIGIALITAIMWLLAGESFEFALTNAISILVISCPCALGLATPVAIMVGTGKAAEYGILIKSAESLETLHSIDTIVLDKTGTITSGHPSVTDIYVEENTMEECVFLAEAAAVEMGSEHPLAMAIVEKAKAERIRIPVAEEFEAVSGRGVFAKVNGADYVAGNLAYIEESQTLTPERKEKLEKEINRLAGEGKTPLLFYKDGALAGIIAVADTVRPDSRQAVQKLKEAGIHVVMLTGDNHVTAEAIRQEVGIEQVISDVLPTEKEACIRKFQAEGHKVAMVGDGINDAPALTRADVGIAIGAGMDIAVDSADVVLMKDSLYDVVTAIRLSHSVIRNIRMNLFWAFFYNILGIPVAAGLLYPIWGLRLSPMIGSAAMSVSSVCVVTNALRLRFFKGEPSLESRTVSVDLTVENNNEKQEEKKGNDNMKKVLVVEGMACGHCKANVEKVLMGVEGVAEAVVDLEKKEALVTLAQDVSDETLTGVVTEAGYTVVSCNSL